ncbi:2OG-Fe(II) oxygenase [Marinomonas algicola]|uniref:2OG-Fe(II) oxygenase n=1 Tax=Marinomonas algicola TaxID=2773454 RepID=UPI001EFF4CA6|nr:2OG-Fe(II) oxygenase [Marinomonas algicola]
MITLTGLDNFMSVSAIEILASSLKAKGWCVLDDAFSCELIDSLVMEVNQLPDEMMQQAGIGRKSDHQVKLDVRQDCIMWIDGNTPARRDFLVAMEALKVTLNRMLLLGLFDYEAHFARYHENGYYDKHFDAFVGKGNRVLSTVLYLNERWLGSNGGELVMFDEHDVDKSIATILPVKGRFVVFLSESFAHQVNPANVCRHSIAGWYRVNATDRLTIDPSR